MMRRSEQTQAEILAAEIADGILRGEFAPGFRLDEQTLANRYGVSRTPVREAIRQLAATGLVEVRPRRSAIVAKVTSTELEAMFVAMGELEATCARLAALQMTPIERRRIKAQQEGMGAIVTADDTAAFAEENMNFHALIYAGAHNPILADMTLALRRRLDPYRRAQFRSPGRLPRSHAEHAAIVAAITAGDATAAHAAMLDHVSLVEDSFSRLVAAHAA